MAYQKRATPHGGRRPGSGRKKGSKDPHTLAKQEAREALRVLLTKEMVPVAEALVSRCKGVRYFVTRDKKTGKYILVTNPEQVVAALNGDDENAGEFYTDKPDTAAIKEYLDRIVDKAKEQEQEIKISGTLNIESRLKTGRDRLAKRG